MEGARGMGDRLLELSDCTRRDFVAGRFVAGGALESGTLRCARTRVFALVRTRVLRRVAIADSDRVGQYTAQSSSYQCAPGAVSALAGSERSDRFRLGAIGTNSRK